MIWTHLGTIWVCGLVCTAAVRSVTAAVRRVRARAGGGRRWKLQVLVRVGDGSLAGSRPCGSRRNHGVPATTARCCGGGGVNNLVGCPIPVSAKVGCGNTGESLAPSSDGAGDDGPRGCRFPRCRGASAFPLALTSVWLMSPGESLGPKLDRRDRGVLDVVPQLGASRLETQLGVPCCFLWCSSLSKWILKGAMHAVVGTSK